MPPTICWFASEEGYYIIISIMFLHDEHPDHNYAISWHENLVRLLFLPRHFLFHVHIRMRFRPWKLSIGYLLSPRACEFANSLLRAEILLPKGLMRAVASILSQIVAMAFVVTMAAFSVVSSSTTPAGAFAMSDRDKYTCKDSGFQLMSMDTAASPITYMIQVELLPLHHQLMLQLLCLQIWIEWSASILLGIWTRLSWRITLPIMENLLPSLIRLYGTSYTPSLLWKCITAVRSFAE